MSSYDQCGYGLALTSPPASEPVSLTEMKLWLRVEHDSDDGPISELITSARELAEQEYDRQFITASWRVTLPRFPGCGGTIRLPRCPLRSVSSITYLDYLGATQTLSTDVYVVAATRDPGLITLADGESWPTTYIHPEAVTITYSAGYGDEDDVPRRAKLAIKVAVAWWYERRGDEIDAVRHELPAAATRLLNSLWNGCYAS